MKKSEKLTMEFTPEELGRLLKRIWNREPVEVHVALTDFVEAHLSEEGRLRLRRAYKEMWDHAS